MTSANVHECAAAVAPAAPQTAIHFARGTHRLDSSVFDPETGCILGVLFGRAAESELAMMYAGPRLLGAELDALLAAVADQTRTANRAQRIERLTLACDFADNEPAEAA
jgi:hypothetical protein